MAEISIFDPKMFIWLDVSSRRYGYSIRGIPPQDHRLFIRGTRYSAIPIMFMQGIHDVQLFEGTVNYLNDSLEIHSFLF